MLMKLMKHELRATMRTMGPMLGLVLLTAAGGNIAIYDLEQTAHPVFNALGFILLAAFVLAMLAAGLVAFVLMIRRFYTNLLRDEGYLTMTLPVSVHQQILSKTIVSVLWFVLTGVTMALAMGVLLFRLEMARDMAEFVGSFFSEMRVVWGDISLESKSLAFSLMAYLPAIVLLAGANMCLNCYAAMAIGHSFSGHKGIKSFAAYFGLTALWQALGICAMEVFSDTGLDAMITAKLAALPRTTEVHVVMLGAMAVLLAGCAAEHAITAYFLKNRLNLD